MAGAGKVNRSPVDGASVVVERNRLTLLTEGSERMKALLALIDGAKRSLRLLYYIYSDDKAGRAVRDALGRALQRGVTVALIVDGFGSKLPEGFFQGIEREGASVCRFLPRLGRHYLFRNHQKLALADETCAIIGGFNIENSYFEDGTGWRDLGVLVEGPSADWLAGYFDALSEWTRQPKARIRDLQRALARWSEPPHTRVGWLLGGPTSRHLSHWASTIRDEMRRAKRIELIAGYFAPSPRMMRGIEGVAGRGGARVLTPSKADHKAAVAAARHTYARLLRRGVHVFEYQPQRLHTKLFIIDGAVHVGSANFDMRSTFLNCELMLRVEHRGFAALMRRYFEGELAYAKEITAAEHAKASVLDRLRWSAAYFVMAVVDARVTRGLNFGVEEN